MRITFRKGKRYSGLARLAENYEARRSGEQIATIQRLTNSELWFWYGDGINSLWQGHGKALEECKSEVIEHFRKLIKKGKV